VFDFFRALFKPLPPSSATAKERLRLVLLSDHISLSPETIDALKADLLEVIARYVVIDPAQADVTFEQREHDLAMLASVPIMAIKDSRPAAVPKLEAPAEAESVEPARAEPATPALEPAVAATPAPEAAAPQPSTAEAAGSEPSTPRRNGKPVRRRRRKRAAADASQALASRLPEQRLESSAQA
jgi:cell division topological specificity factor